MRKLFLNYSGLVRICLGNLPVRMSATSNNPAALNKLKKPVEDPKKIDNNEWRRVLTDEQFNVTRQAGTERPFSGEYDKHFAPGKYGSVVITYIVVESCTE